MKINFSLATGMVAFSMLIASTVQADIELTTNGGFETGDTSGWVSFPSGNSTFVVTGDSASGAFAGKLSNNIPGQAAVIKQANLGVGVVTAGQTVTISFDAKGDGVAGGVQFAEFFSEIAGGGVSSSTILGGGPLFPPATSSAYRRYSFTTLTGPNVSGGITLQFNAATGANIGSTSTLQIDNVSVSIPGNAVPEPTSAVLLCMSGVVMSLRRRRC